MYIYQPVVYKHTNVERDCSYNVILYNRTECICHSIDIILIFRGLVGKEKWLQKVVSEMIKSIPNEYLLIPSEIRVMLFYQALHAVSSIHYRMIFARHNELI